MVPSLKQTLPPRCRIVVGSPWCYRVRGRRMSVTHLDATKRRRDRHRPARNAPYRGGLPESHHENLIGEDKMSARRLAACFVSAPSTISQIVSTVPCVFSFFACVGRDCDPSRLCSCVRLPMQHSPAQHSRNKKEKFDTNPLGYVSDTISPGGSTGGVVFLAWCTSSVTVVFPEHETSSGPEHPRAILPEGPGYPVSIPEPASARNARG